jgi:hypothetical protein
MQVSGGFLESIALLWIAGKEAAVSMEYNRKVGGPDAVAAAAANGSAAPSAESRIMSFGSVQITEKDPGGAPRQSNVRCFPTSPLLCSLVP